MEKKSEIFRKAVSDLHREMLEYVSFLVKNMGGSVRFCDTDEPTLRDLCLNCPTMCGLWGEEPGSFFVTRIATEGGGAAFYGYDAEGLVGQECGIDPREEMIVLEDWVSLIEWLEGMQADRP